MKRKLVLWMGLLFAALAGTSALLAHKAESRRGERAGTAKSASKAKSLPADHARRMIYLRGGDEGSWLGVELSDVTSEKAREQKLSGEYGAIVQEVREDSPAAKAGLEKGDVILEFAGEKVRSVAQMERLVRETPPGRAVAFEVSRDGRTRSLAAKLESAPGTAWESRVEIPRFEMPEVRIPNFDFNLMFAGGPRLGISADELTPQLAEYFGVKEGKGVLVREVKHGTPAQKAGLKAGDVIVRVGDSEVGSVADLRRALGRESGEKQQVTLTIVRDRKEQTLNVELEPVRPLMGPRRVAELRDLGISPEEMPRLQADIRAHAAELQKSAQEVREQSEKVREDVRRAMKDQQREMEQLNREVEKLRREQIR